MNLINKVLVVDDEYGMVELLVDSLQSIRKNTNLEFEINTANDGLEAFQKLQNEKYTLIFMDLMMPLMSGMDLIEAMKKHKSENMNSSIVILSGTPDEVDIRSEEDNILILKKPFDMDKLTGIIKRGLYLNR